MLAPMLAPELSFQMHVPSPRLCEASSYWLFGMTTESWSGARSPRTQTRVWLIIVVLGSLLYCAGVGQCVSAV